ncbi:c-type cytochrome [Ciceribacter ferrooxidans]|uniref:C-type cytochrome n=1 Tax=Ciceribacter ferrooxidans TaxID=2509717 RepID=A0A4Q2TU93_9HYPH|nr:c-type cytochrome [Ciceribacter ferrooxidans]RYC23985.1 c-type cytochrome [Ciceribacter ferrooxidans]
MLKSRKYLLSALLLLSVSATPVLAEKLGLGRPALPEEIDAWDVTVLPDGKGLRPGSGDVTTGEAVFGEKCAACHGEFAEGLDAWPVLAGGQGSLKDRRPVKTIGSYWPHLSTVWDYVHRSMPFGSAQTVSVDETYAIVAFLLYSNGLVEDDFVLSKDNFNEVQLPNNQGFYADDRSEAEYPLFSKEPCMKDCRGPVKVTKRAVELKVTPTDPDGKPAGTLPDITGQAPVQQKSEATEPAPSTDTASAQTPAAAPSEATAPVETASAEGMDHELIEEGKTVFKKCQACHKIGDGAKNATGPHLNGVIGRVPGTVDGYKYSKAFTEMQAKGEVWDDARLAAFLENPKTFAAGTKMTFAGLKKEDERSALIAYLKSAGK